MSLAEQTPNPRASPIAVSAANESLRLREAAGLEQSNVARGRLITRSDDGYFKPTCLLKTER